MVSHGAKSSAPLIYTILVSDGSVRRTNLGNSSAVPAPADYNGDGITDLASVQRKSAKLSEWMIQLSPNKMQMVVPLSAPIDSILSGCDFDGDKKADVAGFNSKTRQLYYIKSSTISGNIQSSLLVKPRGTIAAATCADIDGDGKSELITLSRITANGKTPRQSLISAFSMKGQTLFKQARTGRADGVFTMTIVLNDNPAVGFFTRQSSDKTISLLNFYIKKNNQYVLGKMKISPVVDFTSGTYVRLLTTQDTIPAKYLGLLGFTTSRNLFRMDLSDLGAGDLTATENQSAIAALGTGTSGKRAQILSCVTALPLP